MIIILLTEINYQYSYSSLLIIDHISYKYIGLYIVHIVIYAI